MFENILIALSLQGWNDFWQGLTVLSLAIAFIAGYGANRTSKRLGEKQAAENKRQAKELVTLNTKFEEQRDKANESKRKLLELQQQINEPRTVDGAIADKILDWGTKGSVQFGFVATSDEAEKLADELAKLFTHHSWTVDPSVNPMIGSPPAAPGVSIWIKGGRPTLEKMTPMGIEQLPEPVRTLYKVLDEAIIGNRAVEVWATVEPPEDKLVVIVGPKF